MSVGWTCPSVRQQDPLARQFGEPAGPCPGHKGECRVMHTPRSPLTAWDPKELLRIQDRFDREDEE